MTGYGASLDRLRSSIGAGNDLDLTSEDHRLALLRFLNAWGCRNLVTDWHPLALTELQSWYSRAHEQLDGFNGMGLTLDSNSRHDLIDMFDDLSTRTIAHRRANGRDVLVSFGPTATSKTLFVLRPALFVAWDGAIRETLGYRGDGRSYARFAEDLREKIEESKRQARLGGLDLESLPKRLGRPSYTTLAQLFGEYYWITQTRRVSLRSQEEISKSLSWCTGD
jgi:hypothetical protein